MTDLEKNTAEEKRQKKAGRLRQRSGRKYPKLPLDGLKRRFKKGDGDKPGKRKKKKLTKKQIILLSTGAVVLCVGVYFLVDLFTEEELAAVTGENNIRFAITGHQRYRHDDAGRLRDILPAVQRGRGDRCWLVCRGRDTVEEGDPAL